MEDNNFIVDGIDDNDAYYGTTVINAEGVQGTPATHLPVDAIQEFNVQSGPEAEYGWKPGAIVNIGIKSGTNELHGSAYYFHRKARWMRGIFNPAPDPASALRLHEFGASVGGPIVKEKLFFLRTMKECEISSGTRWQYSSRITVRRCRPGGDPKIAFPMRQPRARLPGTCSQLSLKLAPISRLMGERRGVATRRCKTSTSTTPTEKTMASSKLITSSVPHKVQLPVLRRGQRAKGGKPRRVAAVLAGHGDDPCTGARGELEFDADQYAVNQLRFGYNRFSQRIFSADHTRPARDYGINTGVTEPLDCGFPEIVIGPFNRLGPAQTGPC